MGKAIQLLCRKRLVNNNSTLKYNFHNKELDELLNNYNKSYSKFMDLYFSEDNLLSERPYVYGETVIQSILENYNVPHENYLLNVNAKLTELKIMTNIYILRICLFLTL